MLQVFGLSSGQVFWPKGRCINFGFRVSPSFGGYIFGCSCPECELIIISVKLTNTSPISLVDAYFPGRASFAQGIWMPLFQCYKYIVLIIHFNYHHADEGLHLPNHRFTGRLQNMVMELGTSQWSGKLWETLVP